MIIRNQVNRPVRDHIIFQQSSAPVVSLSWPQPPRQPRQDEGDEDRGEQVHSVVVQDGLPADALGGGGLVTHHLPDVGVESWKENAELVD